MRDYNHINIDKLLHDASSALNRLRKKCVGSQHEQQANELCSSLKTFIRSYKQTENARLYPGGVLISRCEHFVLDWLTQHEKNPAFLQVDDAQDFLLDAEHWGTETPIFVDIRSASLADLRTLVELNFSRVTVISQHLTPSALAELPLKIIVHKNANKIQHLDSA